MNLKKFSIQACCGTTSIVYELDVIISNQLLEFIVKQGYTEVENFTKAGLLFAQDTNFIITGPIGSNKLQVKCKTKKSESILSNLEAILAQFE